MQLAVLAAYGPADNCSVFTDRYGRALIYIGGGASVKQVHMILGHASATVTLCVYAHVWPGDDDRARGILDAALADCVRTREVVG